MEKGTVGTQEYDAEMAESIVYRGTLAKKGEASILVDALGDPWKHWDPWKHCEFLLQGAYLYYRDEDEEFGGASNDKIIPLRDPVTRMKMEYVPGDDPLTFYFQVYDTQGKSRPYTRRGENDALTLKAASWVEAIEWIWHITYAKNGYVDERFKPGGDWAFKGRPEHGFESLGSWIHNSMTWIKQKDSNFCSEEIGTNYAQNVLSSSETVWKCRKGHQHCIVDLGQPRKISAFMYRTGTTENPPRPALLLHVLGSRLLMS